MKCGLLGRKLGHSYSPQIHSHLGAYDYQLFEVEPENVEDFLQNSDFSGINVTVPYKKTVIPYLDELTPRAAQLGAVNTIVRRNGKLIGHNTDFFGFQTMLRESGVVVSGKKVLVLGSGGASNTAVAVLKEAGANVVIVSRGGENNYGNLHIHTDASVIVNTTPVGMYPNVGQSPVDLAQFPVLEGVLDVIYNPAATKLLLDAQERNLTTMNGLLMLVAQAKEAAEWFLNEAVSDGKIHEIHQLLRRQMENIVLIGMPGCGKSTVGALLAGKTGRTFVDADAVIAEKAGCSIPEIFARGGEDAFRAIETQVLADLGMQSGLVIATGGGCVTRDENYPLLRQNGTVVWLERDIAALPTDGRPLSQSGKLEQMYTIRKPLYQRFCHTAVGNNATPQQTCEKILEVLK